MENKDGFLPPEIIQNVLNKGFSAETSLDNGRWTPDNPALGHCGVASLVAQDFREDCYIRRYTIPWPWSNRLGCVHYALVGRQTGAVEDYTRDQFPPEFPYDDYILGLFSRNSGGVDMREEILSIEGVAERYQLLKERFIQNRG